MLQSFLNLPAVLMYSLTVIIFCGISIVALIIVRKNLSWESVQENHEVGGFLFNALGLIYAVLISFVVYATWSDYEEAVVFCDDEANTMQDIFLMSEGLPEEYRPVVKEKIVDYLKEVIENDWPLLSIDESNPASGEKLTELNQLYLKMDIKNDEQSIVFNKSIQELNEVMDYRRLRILSSQNHIPDILWTVIIIGAATSVGFSLFFGTRSIIVQAAMTSLFTMTNVIILLLILNLDHPFTGDIRISPAPFEQIYNFLQGNIAN